MHGSDFDELTRRYWHRIVGFFVAAGCESHKAEDLAQDVFVKAWEHPTPRGESPRYPWAWLREIAKTVLVDALRKSGSTQRCVRIDQGEIPADPTPGSLSQLEKSESIQELTQAVARLAPKLRSVVECRMADCTHEETGRRLGFNKRTSQRRWAKALRQLRVALTGGR
jgi:RNA polymerase sigma-70 factor (ECF subfamily)